MQCISLQPPPPPTPPHWSGWTVGKLEVGILPLTGEKQTNSGDTKVKKWSYKYCIFSRVFSGLSRLSATPFVLSHPLCLALPFFCVCLIPSVGLILWVIVWASLPLVCVPRVFSAVYSMSSLLKHQAGCINTPWQRRLASIDVCLAWHFPSIPEPAHQRLPTGLLDPGVWHCLFPRVCVCLPMCALSGLCSHPSASGPVRICRSSNAPRAL